MTEENAFQHQFGFFFPETEAYCRLVFNPSPFCSHPYSMMRSSLPFLMISLFPLLEAFTLQSFPATTKVYGTERTWLPSDFAASGFARGGRKYTKCEPTVPYSTSSALFSLIETSIFVNSASTAVDTVNTAFNVATFLPQPFWLLLVLLPNAQVTKKTMGGLEVVIFFALVHFTIVLASISQPEGTAPIAEFNDVFDPYGSPQAAMINMMTYPNFVSEEWSHVLTWDLFVGRWIWLDGLRRGVFTPHSVLLCNLIGPPGLLLHLATCLVTGKGFILNEALNVETEEKGD